MKLLFNLPLLSSILTVLALFFIGRKKWWGHLFGVANCIVFTIISMRGQWGFMPANIVCGVLYVYTAIKWRRQPWQVQ